MDIGVVFPQTEIGSDPGAIRDYVQAVEDLGYSHLIAYDHVLGADITHYPGWSGGYKSDDIFHEPLVLFGYLAGISKRIGLVTAILILGQRQTALVAKQAAEVDVLSNGRLRLGVGVGWNSVEYEALGSTFQDRGRRAEEQIEVLRKLWTNPVLNYHGQQHTIIDAGINPLPVQAPIPIWMGAGGRLSPLPSSRVLKRIAKVADGWFPQFPPGQDGEQAVLQVQEYARQFGRAPASIGLDARINYSDGDQEFWVARAVDWREMGATHVSINTMRAGLKGADGHIKAIQQFKDVVNS